MKRVSYQYVILRYMPNRVTEEFVNVGVVMYNKESLFLKTKIIDKYGHLTQYFKNINGNYLLQTLKNVEALIRFI